MQYDRFLDIHFVTSTPDDLKKYANDPDKLARKTKAQNLDGYKQGEYQYDFWSDRDTQREVYVNKLQGKFSAKAAAAAPQFGFLPNGNLGLVASPAVRAGGKSLEVLGNKPAASNPTRFDRDHYITCYVDLETLRPGQAIVPEFAELVAWVSAAATAGKIRLNCHGDSAADAGFKMGQSSLSPADFVDALIRHGLKKGNPGDERPHTATHHNTPPKNASWKLDAQATRCEKCSVPFTFMTRKHHCRRCGGIFCDACTKKRRTLSDPLIASGHSAGVIENLRVCDNCARWCDDSATITLVKAHTGLTQITLALCLSARTATEFADMKTGFARNSIAFRLVQALRQQHIHGIQVSGLNEVLAWDGQSFNAVFGVEYPGQSVDKKPKSESGIDPFEGTDFVGSLFKNVSLTIPSSILGARAEGAKQRIPPIFDAPEFITVRDIKIMPCCGGNKLAFGVFTAEQKTLVDQAFKKWKFVQWECIEQPVGRIPELSRAAVNLGEPTGETGGNAAFFTRARFGALNTPTTPAMAAASSRLGGDAGPLGGGRPRFTYLLSAPQRRIHIEWARNDPKSIVVSGLEEHRFKQHKVFELT